MKNITGFRRLSGLTLFGILIAFFNELKAQEQQLAGLPFIRNFSNVEYKAGIQNWDITEDSRGLLYVANNFGLLEYDGNEWKTYSVKNGPKVRSVAIDGRGRIYVGCQREFGYFFPDARGALTYVSLADSLDDKTRNFDEAWSVYLDNEKVYFCTFSSIFIYDQHSFQIATPSFGIDHSYLVNRQLFVNQTSIGLSILEGEGFRLVPGGTFFKNYSVSSVIALHPGNLLVSTFQHGVFQLVDGVIKPWNADMQSYFRESIVNCIIRLRNGDFAIGTQNNGLLILSSEGVLVRHITRGRGIENRTVLSLHEDDLNNLWVGQNNGLAYVELGSPFTFLNEETGLPGSGYSAFLDGEKLYLGTNTGVYLYEDTPDKKFRLIEGTRGQVYHIGKYSNDLLVGHHNGAFRIEGTQAIPVSNEPGTWIFLQATRDHNTLLGGSYSGLQRFELMNGHWKPGKKISGFDESSRVMAQDASGNLWVTHGYKGAFKLTLNATLDSIKGVSFYDATKGFPSHLLINVFRIRNELLFTSERGVFKYDAKNDFFVRDSFFTSMMGENAQVWFMQEDALGNIYFLSREQIGVLKRNAIGQFELESRAFNKIRKYLNDDLINFTVLKNNEVLFGAKDGFIHFDPNRVTGRKSDFHTLIRNVSINNGDSSIFFGNYIQQDSVIQTQLEKFRPQLPYASNSVKFNFAATSFEGNADVVYQYHLENYEPHWLEWTQQTYKEYTNLKEGSYTFRVRAKDVNGEVSQEATYNFTIRPPWFRSVVAYSIYGLSIVALLFTAFNIIDRKYQREQKLLESRQRDELTQKENELEKLSQQSQEEITRLQNEKLESELRHMNNELGTSTMHLLNKNEFIANIKSTLNHLIKKSASEDLKKELVKITKDIDRNISEDGDWEHFQLHFDRVHGDFSNRFKTAFPSLSPQEMKLSAYLRMNLSSKEIAQLLNISLRGVEISRYRLRKKIQLDRNKNLQEFILNF